MNELEHLRALRDKARIQTEQARAVLKQQGEISESLDRLIAALEAKEKQGAMPDLDVQAASVPSTESDSREQSVESLGQMIANLDSREEAGSATSGSDNSEEVVWVEEPKPIIPDLPRKPSTDEPPKLDPIVWEVADSTPVPASTDADESTDPGEDKPFEFSRMDEASTTADQGPDDTTPEIAPPSLDTVAIPVADLASSSSVAAVAAKVNDSVETAPPESIAPSTPAPIDPAPPSIEPAAPPTEEAGKPGEVASPAEEVVSTNIFFDANSAYLKESELEKLKASAACLAGGESRLIKIQGLEDLASSNDFKELLSSRRILAVKKKLAENEIDDNAIQVNEIELSEEGRILNPPAILLKGKVA